MLRGEQVQQLHVLTLRAHVTGSDLNHSAFVAGI